MPIILEYFVPGFIFVSIFQYFTSRNSSNHNIIISVITGCILKALMALSHVYILKNKSFSWSERVIILVIFAIILAIILAIISECKFVNTLFMKINYKSIHNDIWQDTIDYENGTTLKMTCNDVVYTGILVAHEENGNDSWFVLEEYMVEEDDGKYNSNDIPYKCRLAINLKTVNRLELFYGETKDSKINELFKKIQLRLKPKK